jgi:hypothetical protein
MSSIPFRVTHRRTSTPGRVPSLNTILTGELYLQLADERIYFKNANDTRLITVITDASGNGLEKIKFSGASNLDIPYWSGSRFYQTGISNFVQVNQTGNFVISSQIVNFVSKSETGNFITTSQTGTFGGGNVDLSAYALKSQTGNFITTSQTGAFGGASVDLSSYITTSQTGVYAASALTGNFVTTSQTGVYAASALTGNFVTTSQTGVYAAAELTGNFVTTSQTGVYAASALTGNFVTTSQTGVYAAAELTGNFVTTSQTGVYAASALTGNFVTTSQTGVYAAAELTGNFVTTSQTGVYAAAELTGNFVTTSQTGVYAASALTGKFATLDGSNYLCQTQIPNITGDVCINAGSNVSTVYKIQGYPVANTQPANGQTLQFNGSSWVPGDIAAGGNGGGGLVYYFNEAIAADLPTGSLPTSYSGTYELGRTGMIDQKSFETPNLPQDTYSGVVGFISDVLDPQTTSIPAGLFDFNIWASSNTATQTIVKLEVYKYDGATTTASLLASSDDVYTYDGNVTAQYILSVVLPQTTISSTDRLYIRILAKALAGNKKITFYFGGNTPSHVHTTIPSVGGSGLIKLINGIMQSSASALVDADVSASAAIAGSKIEVGYFALASATGSFVTNSQTGNFINTAQTGTYAPAALTGNFVTTSQTGVYAASALTGNFVTTSQTGAYAASALTGNFVTTSQTGVYAAAELTGNFVTTSQTGVYAASALTGNFVTTSQTGVYAASALTGNFVTTSQTGVYAASALTGNFVTTSQTGVYAAAELTGNFVTTSQTGVYAASALTGNFVTTSQTGVYAAAELTGNFVTTSQTGVYAASALTGNFVTTSQTGVYAASALTGNFVTTSQTGVYAASALTGNFVTTSQTGVYAASALTGNFVVTANTGNFVTTAMTGAFTTQTVDLSDYVNTGSTGNFVTRNQTGQLGDLILSNLNLNLNQSYFSKADDSYACSVAARKYTTNANVTYLENNNSTSLVNLDAGDHLAFTATINAIGCEVASYAYFKIEGSARRYAFLSGGLTVTCSTLNGETSNQVYSSSYSGYNAFAEIDDSSNSLRIKVIGDSSHQQQWFAKIDVVKNNYIIDSQIILPQTLYFSGNSSNYNWFNCNNWYTNTQLTSRSLSFAQTGSSVIVCGNKGPLIDLTCNLWNTPVLINALNLTDASGVCFYSPDNQPTGFSGIVSGTASFFGGAYLI